MGLGYRLARQSLRQRPGRTFFSVLGVAVGIATVVAIFTLDHNTVLSRSRPSATDWTADLEVRPGDELDDPRGRLSEIDGIAGLSAYFQKDALLRAERAAGEARPERRLVRLVALEADAAAQLGAYHLAAGRDIDAGATESELLLGDALAAELGVEAGERVYLAQPQRMAQRVCIDGQEVVVDEQPPEPIDHAFRVAGVLAREKLGRKAMGQVVVVDFARGAALFADSFVQPSYLVMRDQAVDIERLEESLGRDFTYSTNRSAVVGQQADERAFRNGVRIAGLLALVLGLFVIFHTLSMSLVERVREVAVLHALGASRRQIGRIFFGEALLIAALAAVLGLAGGLLLALVMLRMGITTLGVSGGVDVFEVPWNVVAPLVGVGVSIALLGSVYPLLRARGTDVVTALRGEEVARGNRVARGFHLAAAILLAMILPALYFVIVPVVGESDRALVGVVLAGLGVLGLLVALPLVAPGVVGAACRAIARPFSERWPLAGKLSARSIQQSPSRAAASVTAIALVTAAFVGLKGMTNSLRAETVRWAEESVVNKVWVDGLPNTDFEALRAQLARYPGVLGVEPGDSKVTGGPFDVVGVRTQELARYGPCADDPALLRAMEEGQGMILSRRLAQHQGKKVGDPIHLHTPGSGVQSFPVVAISDAYGYSPHPDERMYGVISDSLVERYYCLDRDTSTRIAVRLADGADSSVVPTAVHELLPNEQELRFEGGDSILAFHLKDITRDFFLFDIIFGLTALLAALGVLNGQLLTAMERSKELGVLRALGMTRRQVAGMVLLESGVVGACGGVLGLALGGLMTPVIVEALQVISGLPLPHKSAGPYLGLCLAGALALALVAGLYPIWRMNRLDAVRAVRTS